MILTIKDERVFDALVRGEKSYEGRKWKEDYRHLRPGDYLLFVLEGGGEILLTEVTDVKRFGSVREMVDALWKELIPWASSPEEALKVYRSFYSPEDEAVALGVKPIHLFRLNQRSAQKWLGLSLPPLKVAFGVDNGELFDGHFGDAPSFWIYEVTLDGYRLLEKRPNTTEEEEEEEHGHHHGNPAKFRAIYSILKDVDVWAAFRMGPNYVRIVKETDKVPFITGTRKLQEALDRVRRKYLSLALRRVCRGNRENE